MSISLTPGQLIEIGSLIEQVGRFIPRTLMTGLVANGQCGEADILRKILPQNEGFYVDVGAGDPESCSNTWAFYQAGWSGLLIEPCPEFWYRLLRLRQRDHLIPIACSDVDGYGKLRIFGTCSSLRPDWNILEQSSVLIETMTLATILKEFPQIQRDCKLCSIDVEGLEKHVLLGIDWDNFHPDVFCVEYLRFAPDKPREDLSGEWESILLDHGYVRQETTPMNYIYVTKEINARLTAEKEAEEAEKKRKSESDQKAKEENDRLIAKIEAERLAKTPGVRYQNGQLVE